MIVVDHHLPVSPVLFDDTVVSKNLTDRIVDSEILSKGELVFGNILTVCDPKVLTFQLVKEWIEHDAVFPRKKSKDQDSTKSKKHVLEMTSNLYVMALKQLVHLKFRAGTGHELSLTNFPLPTMKELNGDGDDQEDVFPTDPQDIIRAQLFYRAIKLACDVFGMPVSANREHLMAIGTKFESISEIDFPKKFYPGGGARTKSRKLRDKIIDHVTDRKRFTRNRPKGIKKGNSKNRELSNVDRIDISSDNQDSLTSTLPSDSRDDDSFSDMANSVEFPDIWCRTISQDSSEQGLQDIDFDEVVNWPPPDVPPSPSNSMVVQEPIKPYYMVDVSHYEQSVARCVCKDAEEAENMECNSLFDDNENLFKEIEELEDMDPLDSIWLKEYGHLFGNPQEANLPTFDQMTSIDESLTSRLFFPICRNWEGFSTL